MKTAEPPMKNCEGITEIFVDRYANSLTHTKFGLIKGISGVEPSWGDGRVDRWRNRMTA
jgi:hypothetical protein